MAVSVTSDDVTRAGNDVSRGHQATGRGLQSHVMHLRISCGKRRLESFEQARRQGLLF